MSSIPHLVASAYLRKLDSGKTKPIVLKCEDQEGTAVGEFVVKLKAGIDSGPTGLTCELISSILARLLGIPVPEPAAVSVDRKLAEFVPMETGDVAEAIRRSHGLNFGTRVLPGGYKTWPVDMPIPIALRQAAVAIFAFDALIDNPDRRHDNPNVLWRGDELFAIDHESAFSFVFAIVADACPWKMEVSAYLDDHVFFEGLKGDDTDISRFAGSLERITDEAVSEMASEVPSEWKSDHLMKILEHIKRMRDHAPEFAEQVRRRLA